MPIGATSSSLIVRLGLAVVYLVLALALNPLLIEHELALPSDLHHSESDLCAWLDHVAGTSLQSTHLTITVAVLSAPVDLLFQSPLRSVSLFGDPSRGPPVLI
jgi:ABC-type iron transport system FetAB ATPase subunit